MDQSDDIAFLINSDNSSAHGDEKVCGNQIPFPKATRVSLDFDSVLYFSHS
jgi:hypothetical protein